MMTWRRFAGVASLLILIGAFVAVFAFRQQRKRDLWDADPVVRVAAIRAWPTLDPDAVIDALHDPDADVRIVAIWHLDRSHDRCIAELVAALKDEHAGVRREAAEALGRIGPRATEALAAALADEHPRVRAGAALALRQPGVEKVPRQPGPDEQARLTPLLVQALKDSDEAVRRNAVRTLAAWDWHPLPGELRSVVAAAFTEALTDPDAEVRDEAMRALDHLKAKR